MNQELQMFHDAALHLYHIPLYEISRILEKISPFHKTFPTRNEIIEYAKKVNGSLKERNSSRDVLKLQYLTAASLYAFVQPVVHLNLDSKLERQFITIAEHRPYLLANPLEIILNKELEEEQQTIEEHLQAHVISLEEHPKLDEEAIFKYTQRAKKRIEEGTAEIASLLQKRYTEAAHFTFVSLYDICFPLFNVKSSNTEFPKLNTFLKENYGHIQLKIPLYFSTTPPSDVST